MVMTNGNDLTESGEALFPAIILVGELRGSNRATITRSFDPRYKLTDGQQRAYAMKLYRLMKQERFASDNVMDLDDSMKVIVTQSVMAEVDIIYCAIFYRQVQTADIAKLLIKVANRGGIYTAKRYYQEIVDLIEAGDEEVAISLDETPTPENASLILRSLDIQHADLADISNLLILVAVQKENLVDTRIFETTRIMLNRIAESEEVDVVLDASFLIADGFMTNGFLKEAYELFSIVAEQSTKYERLALEISSRIRNATILKGQGESMQILNELAPIDDGSLEVATANDREGYYCLHAYAFDKMNDKAAAEDLYHMAILIADPESFPTIAQADAHAYIGVASGTRFEFELASRELLTSSNIAARNNDIEKSIMYAHQAAVLELEWSDFFASAAVISQSEDDTTKSEFYAWQSLKKLAMAFSHSNPAQRRTTMQRHQSILDKIKIVITENQEYGHNTLEELNSFIKSFVKQEMPLDQEREVFKYILTKISAMLPIPTPVIMLIAIDGRYITGGEVSAESWDEEIMENDDLFSGALSAIMSILSEVITGESPLRMVDAGSTQIMIERSDVCIGALLVDRDLNIIRTGLREAVNYMDASYPGLQDWDGYSIDFSKVPDVVRGIFRPILDSIQV